MKQEKIKIIAHTPLGKFESKWLNNDPYFAEFVAIIKSDYAENIRFPTQKNTTIILPCDTIKNSVFELVSNES